jgi:[NiFe] hydrogenase diaphorase moiety large subunit
MQYIAFALYCIIITVLFIIPQNDCLRDFFVKDDTMLTTAEDITPIIERFGYNRDNLIQILLEIKKEYSQISSFAMQIVAYSLGIEPAEVYSVVSFYPFLGEKTQGRFTIRLCRALSCEMVDKESIAEQLTKELGVSFGQTTPDGLFTLEWTHCLGACDQGPALLVNDRLYTHLTVGSVSKIIQDCLESAEETMDRSILFEKTIPTSHIEMLSFPTVEPWSGLKSVLNQSRQEIFNTFLIFQKHFGEKFISLLNDKERTENRIKYIVCNTDEGGPGSFKDRIILFHYASLMIEGMIISGYVSGISKGIIYLKGQYVYLQTYLEDLLNDCRQKNLLGNNILNKAGFNFDLEIRLGAGSFIGKEESALIKALEGKRSEPGDASSPFYFINNAENYIWLVKAFAKIADRFNNIKFDPSVVTKLFSVSGDCMRPGIYEFPLGISVSSLLDIVGGTKASGIYIGGVTGKYISAKDFGHKISIEDIPTGGTVIVFGQGRNMVGVAKNLLGFFVEESCGQCTPCREGVPKLLEGVNSNRVSRSRYYLSDLKNLSDSIKISSKCSLGQSAPNIFLSVMKDERFIY